MENRYELVGNWPAQSLSTREYLEALSARERTLLREGNRSLVSGDALWRLRVQLDDRICSSDWRSNDLRESLECGIGRGLPEPEEPWLASKSAITFPCRPL